MTQSAKSVNVRETAKSRRYEMKDQYKTKKQLIDELAVLRAQVARLEGWAPERGHVVAPSLRGRRARPSDVGLARQVARATHPSYM